MGGTGCLASGEAGGLLPTPRAGLVASWLGAAEGSAHDLEQLRDA
jgi:hypothetical protein